MIQQGSIDIADGSLEFRFVDGPLPLLVFENGWGASFEQWAWMERHLAGRARLLFYSRAGIGGSRLSGPKTVAGLSAQFAGLLSALQIAEPVVLVGHSYGGLMCDLHAVQQPAAVHALVEIDPTPHRDAPVVDAPLRMVPALAKIVMLCARLGIPDPLFSPAGRSLPSPAGRQLVEKSFASIPSLRAALQELALLPDIRAAIARRTTDHPRLILSADRGPESPGWIGRLLVSAEKRRAVIGTVQGQHRAKAGQGIGSRWEALPHDHGALVFTAAGAQACAARLMAFVEALPAAGR